MLDRSSEHMHTRSLMRASTRSLSTWVSASWLATHKILTRACLQPRSDPTRLHVRNRRCRGYRHDRRDLRYYRRDLFTIACTAVTAVTAVTAAVTTMTAVTFAARSSRPSSRPTPPLS